MSTNTIDSVVSFRNSQGDKATGTLRGISRQTVSIEVYNPYSIVQLSEVLSNLSIRRATREIYNGRAVVSSLVNTGIYLVISAALVDPWQDLSGVTEDDEAIEKEVERFLGDWDIANKLSPSFTLIVSRLRSLLSELSRWLDQVDLMNSVKHSNEGDDKIMSKLESLLLPNLNEEFMAFEDVAEKIEPDDLVLHSAFAQRDLHPYLLRAPFVWRAYNKPLGYAGDYEMVNMMLSGFNQGPTTHAKVVNDLFLAAGPALAHRNRIDILVGYLEKVIEKAAKEKRPAKVLNIGCGPAEEIQRLLGSQKIRKEDLDLTLLDFNDETLGYTQSKISDACKMQDSSVEPTFIHKSVHELLKDSARQNAKPEYDMVYCAGLFDYLSDKVCSRLVKLFYQQTIEGGKVLVTNVHPRNPGRQIMEFLMEWHLIYRNEAQMDAIYPGHGKQKNFCDDSGVNIFLDIDKSS